VTVNPLALAFAQAAQELRTQKPKAQDTEEHWRAADLSYKMWDVQKKMAHTLRAAGENSALKKVLNCSRRLRKSTTALIVATELCLKKQGAQVRFVAPTGKMLRKIIRPLMRMICEDCPEDLKPIWKSQDSMFYFPSTGAELHLAGANNGHEDDSRGTAADMCVIDEAQLIKNLRYLVEDVLMPQLITSGGPLFMLLTPPKTPVHECLSYVLEAKLAQTYAEFDIHQGEYPPDVIEKFCKEAGGPDSTTWLREYMCQFIVDKNFSIVPEWVDAMVEEYVPDEFARFYLKYEGMDIGVRHLTVNLYGVYDFRKATLFVQDETVISGPDMTTKKLAEQIRAKEAQLWGEPKIWGANAKPHLRIADNNNLILLQDLGHEHGIQFAPTTKDTLEAMVNNIRLWVGQKKLRVSPRCEQLTGALKYGVWNDKRKDWEESHVYGHFDALAALMYLLRYVDTVTNPIPGTFGLNADTQFIRPQSNLSQNAATLRRALGVKK